MDIYDTQTLGVVVFGGFMVVSAIGIFLVSTFSMKETSYEEAPLPLFSPSSFWRLQPGYSTRACYGWGLGCLELIGFCFSICVYVYMRVCACAYVSLCPVASCKPVHELTLSQEIRSHIKICDTGLLAKFFSKAELLFLF